MTSLSPCPAVPVSWGELLDKLSILEIKRRRIADDEARSNVEREHALLAPIAAPALAMEGIAALMEALRGVNAALWDIEDAIRGEEAQGAFGSEFVRLARAVYRRNDERGAIKRAINLRLGSALIEEKSYAAGSGSAQPARSA